MDIDDYFREEQRKKIQNYQDLNRFAQKGQILFTGSSLMEQFPVTELSISHNLGKIVYNRGVGGYTTDDFLREIDTVLLDLEPCTVFLNIGTNDINARFGEETVEGEPQWLRHLTENYDRILSILKEKLPETKVYLLRYYPVNLPFAREHGYNCWEFRTNEKVDMASAKAELLAEKYGYTFLDANKGLQDEEGNQKAEFAVDGIHMRPLAYEVVYQNLLPYLSV